MITRSQFLESASHEIAVIKHLVSKVQEKDLGYRPTANMRSMLELLQYLTTCGISLPKAISAGNWEILKQYSEQSKTLTLADIPKALDAELNELRHVVQEFSDEDFKHREIAFPWGTTAILGSALLNSCLKFLTAYRMQLFMYLKQNGHPELNTLNLWMGVDGQMPTM